MNEKIKVLKLARKKYKAIKIKKYGIESLEGTCLIDALIEVRKHAVTWQDAKYFLMDNFGMRCEGLEDFSDEKICKIFLKDFKFVQKTMNNE